MQVLHSDVIMFGKYTRESDGGVSGRGGVCGRVTPSGGNFTIYAIAEHLHAQKMATKLGTTLQ